MNTSLETFFGFDQLLWSEGTWRYSRNAQQCLMIHQRKQRHDHHKHRILKALYFSTISSFQPSVIVKKPSTSDIYGSLDYVFGKKIRGQKRCMKLVSFTGRGRLQNSILIGSELNPINQLLVPLKLSKYRKFPYENSLICLNLLRFLWLLLSFKKRKTQNH